MKRSAFVLVSLLTILGMLLPACAPAGSGVRPGGMPAAGKTLPAVRVAEATTGYIAEIREYSGKLEAVSDVNVMPQVSGRIESVLAHVGDEVKAGDVLATVDDDIYAAQLEQAQASLEQARLNLAKLEEGSRPETIRAARAAVESGKATLADVETVSDAERTAAAAGLAQAEASLKQAQTEYDKVAWSGDAGMSRQGLALQQATTAYEAALAAYDLAVNPSASAVSPLESQLAQAESQLALAENPYTETDLKLAGIAVRQAQVALQLAQIQVDETSIKAPFDGIVAEVYVDQGDMVNAAASVAKVVSSGVEMVFDVEETFIADVTVGQHAALQVVAFPGVDFPATVSNIAPIADSASHTFSVRVMPTDQNSLLKGGMYAHLSLLVHEKDAALLVPKAAVFQSGGTHAVYVVNQDMTVSVQPVTAGFEDSEQVEIVAGLEAGQRVVVSGLSKLQDGVTVQVRE